MESTPDNSNLVGKLKEARVIESSKQIIENKQMGKGRNASEGSSYPRVDCRI